MDSNSSRYQQQHHQHHQPNSGLLRFRSAPSSIQIGGASNSLREFEDKEPNESTSSPSLSRMNSHQQGYVPSRFMRPGSIGSTSAMDHQAQPKIFGSDLLLRQSSFPAGHFSTTNISFHNNGYGTTKGVPINSGDSELSLSTNRLNNQISFSSRSGHEFPSGSWNDTSHSGSKDQNSNDKLFSDAQNYGEFGNQVHTLSHHLSFPKASSEIFAMENMIQFPDSVPCKIRAKRGCATHPRSIAERVRRTRISERIRKLQELVPNMDKQTSTADMLDLAAVYIKDLQKQFKNLNERRAKCICMSMQK